MEIKFEIKKTAAQANAGKYLEMFKKDLENKKEAGFNIFLAEDHSNLFAYFEEVSKENCIGRVLNADNNADIRTLMEYDYACRITSVDDTGKMSAVIRTLAGEPVVTNTKDADLGSDEKEYLDSLVSEGYMTKENLDKRMAIAKEHGISFKLMKKLVFENIRKRGIKEELTPLKTMYVNTEKGEKNPTRFFWQAVGNCATGDAFILEGPKSVGKNVFCETLAFLFNKEYFVIQLNENTSDGDVYGEKSTDNSAAAKITMDLAFAAIQAQTLMAQGKPVSEDIMKKASEFEYYKSLASSVKIVQALGVWVQWLQRGGIMVLNEMDMADANFFSQLVNMILDGTGFMTVPGYGRVDVNPECVLIGTQNGDSYAGTNQQNSASISRFDKYILPQPKDVINQLKSACKGQGFSIEDKYIIACNEFYKDLRKKSSMSGFEGVISDTCLNIRGMVRALKAVVTFDYEVTLKERLKLSVVNACAEDERPIIMQALNEKVTC